MESVCKERKDAGVSSKRKVPDKSHITLDATSVSSMLQTLFHHTLRWLWKHLWSEGSSAVGRRGLASSIALWTLQAAPQECRVTLKQGAGCSWAAVPLKIRSPSRDCKWAWAEQLQVIHDGPHWAKTWTQWVAWAVRPQPLSYMLRTGLFPSEKKHRLAYDLSNLNRRNSTSFLHVLQQQ